MCDYSLHNVMTRPAKVGDKLVTAGFNRSITRGFAPEGQLNVAVCLRPGTEVAFDRDIETMPVFGWLPTKKHRTRTARFRKVNEDCPNLHHDALELPDGKVILLTHLCEGQKATVLQLPATQVPASGVTQKSAALENAR